MEAQVLEAERELRRAVLERDIDALDALLADDVLFVGPDGSVIGKTQDLEAHRSGALRVLRYDPVGEPQIHQIAEGVACLLSTIDVVAEVQGTRHEMRLLYTRVFVRREGRLQVVLAQGVPVHVE